MCQIEDVIAFQYITKTNFLLKHYLMADVLESQYAILLKSLASSSNFEELLHAHEVFLASVTAHTFINNKPVNWTCDFALSGRLIVA